MPTAFLTMVCFHEFYLAPVFDSDHTLWSGAFNGCRFVDQCAGRAANNSGQADTKQAGSCCHAKADSDEAGCLEAAASQAAAFQAAAFQAAAFQAAAFQAGNFKTVTAQSAAGKGCAC